MRESGFATWAVIILIALLLIAAIVFVGYRRLDINPLGSATPYPTPKPTASAAPAPSQTPAPGTYDAGQAFSQVQSFYQAYQQNASSLSKYVSPQLASQINSGSNSTTSIYCSFNVPSSISYGTPTSANNAATVVAEESFVNSPDVNVTLTVSLSTLKITAITCPPSQ